MCLRRRRRQCQQNQKRLVRTRGLRPGLTSSLASPSDFLQPRSENARSVAWPAGAAGATGLCRRPTARTPCRTWPCRARPSTDPGHTARANSDVASVAAGRARWARTPRCCGSGTRRAHLLSALSQPRSQATAAAAAHGARDPAFELLSTPARAKTTPAASVLLGLSTGLPNLGPRETGDSSFLRWALHDLRKARVLWEAGI